MQARAAWTLLNVIQCSRRQALPRRPGACLRVLRDQEEDPGSSVAAGVEARHEDGAHLRQQPLVRQRLACWQQG